MKAQAHGGNLIIKHPPLQPFPLIDEISMPLDAVDRSW